MNKFSWVFIESVLAGLGFGYALLVYLEHYSSVNVAGSFALTVAMSFAFGVIMSLIVIGMSGSRSR
jgi:formate/nitrite transporter FocA (FNT family)